MVKFAPLMTPVTLPLPIAPLLTVTDEAETGSWPIDALVCFSTSVPLPDALIVAGLVTVIDDGLAEVATLELETSSCETPEELNETTPAPPTLESVTEGLLVADEEMTSVPAKLGNAEAFPLSISRPGISSESLLTRATMAAPLSGPVAFQFFSAWRIYSDSLREKLSSRSNCNRPPTLSICQYSVFDVA